MKMNRKSFLGSLAASIATLHMSTKLSALAHPKKIKILDCEVLGLYYYDYNAVRHTLREKAYFQIQRESNNSHDYKAVKVYFQNTKLGYLPRGLNLAIASLMNAGMKMQVQATFVYYNRLEVEV
jgi:hypothetical protein